MKQIRFSAAIVAMSMLITFSACKKTVAEEEDWQSATDHATADVMYETANKAVDEASVETGAQRGAPLTAQDAPMTTCANITAVEDAGGTLYNGKKFPRTITIDYGTTNVACGSSLQNTRNFRGKILININKPHRLAGSVATITFDNFYVNDHKLEGTRTNTNTAIGANGQPIINISMVGGKVTDPDGKTFTWNTNHTRTWLAGFETLTAVDNRVNITGSASGVSRAGKAFSATILTPLQYENACRYIMSGSVKITRDNLKDRVIDFGNGACDGVATVTVDGQTKTINLK